ncbi:hypothetical protein [Lichenifustis flavocetrariae]|uniref:Uncharacterized protein n=1 Tax=Lichenifustis flavocetrariae TaxID=2949735 RepID=A0AA42CMH0_9HYPH|nr:hypothetical protein [Lichenifustis flavocetrariae]MCW6512543.1 hypothetical protein [Lichenifustis flavocetrariae]
MPASGLSAGPFLSQEAKIPRQVGSAAFSAALECKSNDGENARSRALARLENDGSTAIDHCCKIVDQQPYVAFFVLPAPNQPFSYRPTSPVRGQSASAKADLPGIVVSAGVTRTRLTVSGCGQ